MTTARWHKLKAVFHAVLERGTAQHAVMLGEACELNPTIVAEVRSLLASHRQASSFMERSMADVVMQPSPFGPAPPVDGRRLGQYTLIREIGSGGMGTVYEAMQANPHRRVALKVMRAGVAATGALQRFRRESQLLGRLQHPGIAQVFEAGTQDDGGPFGEQGPVPYFAMEFVPDAQTIVDYANARRLSIRARLEIFERVCGAVEHGHRRGVLHRDLKPANILVDSSGQPKIIDFGIARAADSDALITSLRTGMGQLIGTLQYMSPEQCLVDSHDLDTRSDVYTLGLVLYELLCGRPPYDVGQMSLCEATRVICQRMPRRPCMINPRLGGDLETILLTALEKERERRYQSASDLARDIRRYLGDEPILARPARVMHQLRMLARRNRVASAACMASLAVLIVGIFATSFAAVLAVRAETRARQQRDVARAVNGFVNDMLFAADPAESRGQPRTVEEVLGTAARTIDTSFADQPEVAAALRLTIGSIYLRLGLPDRADAHLVWSLETRRDVLGDNDPDTLASMDALGSLRRQQGRFDDAEALFSRALDGRCCILGEEHSDTLVTMNNLAYLYSEQDRLAEAEAMFERTLAIRRRIWGESVPETLVVMHNFARLLQKQGRLDQAEALSRQALDGRDSVIGEDHPDTLSSMNNHAGLLREMGRLDDAEAMFRRTLELRLRVSGPEHPATLTLLNNLAVTLREQGKLDESEPIFEQVLEVRCRVWGEEHPSTLTVMNNLASVLAARGRLDDAEALGRRTVELRIRVLGGEHADTLITRKNLAGVLRRQGKLNESEVVARECLETAQRVLPQGHWQLASIRSSWGQSLRLLGRFEEAEAALQESLEEFRLALGDGDDRTRAVITHLIELHDARGRPEESDKCRVLLSAKPEQE